MVIDMEGNPHYRNNEISECFKDEHALIEPHIAQYIMI
jgi:hypothetical protein